ncbi:tetratricopeptide repeat protein [Bosea sp. (in: a-proteobacteria)]|uniref:tetratricopeptide repeat protein n=1 Tax=Bosea sp. (in: a-proteobacteria) TaxID=1871050 RepID=UPI0026288FC3|nr:tetratricopeptide repeat protein [Bosea sp. (in: a-proteobacteria)]MCO5089446.1 tetratricopeptide repeat protein [Bosea sp. (in: a-proteobacteria)]
MIRRYIASVVLASLLAPAGSFAGGAALAQTMPPLRPGIVAPDDKAQDPAGAAKRGPAATLERLFQRLHDAATQEEAEGVARLIQRRWARSGSDTADLLMSRAQQALKDKQNELAIELLDRIISLQPDWAEAWNQRANALYLAGDSIRSMLDIGETLKREPRHYGAMMGLGMILRQQGEDKAAMAAFRKALEVYPQFDAVRKAVDALKTEVDGRDA